MKTLAATVGAAVLLWTAIVLPAQEWLDYTQWRGPHRDGGASGFVAPASWPDKLTFRWKTDVGEGYGTPLIVGGVVYAFTRRGTDETAAALDAGTGRQTWSSGYAVSYTPAAAAAEHGASPKATPAYCDGKLFTLGISGIVTAFEATSGKRLWQTAPPAEAPDYGAASSPLCERNLVIVHPGNYGPLTAFDAATGVVRWTAGGDGFFMSPIAADIDGVRQIVTVTQKEVIGVLPADGTVLWRYPWSGGGSGGTMPVLFNDTVIVSALDAGVVAIAPARHGNEWTVATAWTTREVSMYVSNPVIAGDALFGLSHRARGQYFALDAKTGKTLWLGPPRQATNTAVVRAGELLVLLNDDGELIVARSSRSGFDPLKRYTVATSATWAQPAISGNRILVKDVSSITLWTVD
jgi:outer membrane protein assembly factor BamB